MARASQRNTISNDATTLGAKLKDCWSGYAQNRPVYEEAVRQYEKLLLNDVIQDGLTVERWGSPSYKTRDKKLRACAGLVPTEKTDEDGFTKVTATMVEIANSKPAGFRELAALANACAIANMDLWNVPLSELEWNGEFTRRLVEAVLSLANEPLVLDGVPTVNTVGPGAFQMFADSPDLQQIAEDIRKNKTEKARVPA